MKCFASTFGSIMSNNYIWVENLEPFRGLSVQALQLNCYEYDILGIYSTIRVCHLQASCIFMSWIKGFSASPCQPPTKNFHEIQMVKCSLFMEKKGSDGNHTLDATIILLLVSCHSHHSEGRMETCTPLFNFFPHHFSPPLSYFSASHQCN